MWDYEGTNLDKDIIEEELKIFSKLNIEIVLNSLISKNELKNIISENNAVFLGTGEWDEDLKIDPDTFQVNYSSVFAGEDFYIKMIPLFYP